MCNATLWVPLQELTLLREEQCRCTAAHLSAPGRDATGLMYVGIARVHVCVRLCVTHEAACVPVTTLRTGLGALSPRSFLEKKRNSYGLLGSRPVMLVEITPFSLAVGATSTWSAVPQVSFSRWYSTTYTVTTPTSGWKEMVTEVSVRSEWSGATPEAGGKTVGRRRGEGVSDTACSVCCTCVFHCGSVLLRAVHLLS